MYQKAALFDEKGCFSDEENVLPSSVLFIDHFSSKLERL